LKDIVKFAIVFGVLYLLWNVFWRSVFFSVDAIGVIATLALLSLLIDFGTGDLRLGRQDRIHLGVNQPKLELPTPLPDETSPEAAVTAEDNSIDPSEVEDWERRCAEVWNRSLKQRRNYRMLRRESASAEWEESPVDDEARLVSDLDVFFDSLCSAYWKAEAARREHIRALLGNHRRLLGNLPHYSSRVARRLREASDPDFLELGLAAISIDDDRSGYDAGPLLGDQWREALIAGIDPAPYFQRAVDISSNEPYGVRQTIATFRASRDFKTFVEYQLRRRGRT
jgi:hypothetical protein